MIKPIHTLHIDIEGGHGGSSRSLFELVSRLDRNQFKPLVVHRLDGPIVQKYAEIGIPTVHIPEIASYAPRNHKNFKNLIATLPRLVRILKAIKKISSLAVEHNTQLVHLNYEGLFVMAPLIKRYLKLPMVGHSRTQIPDNIWGKIEAKTLSKYVSHMFFISPREEDAFRRHAPVQGDVIWNIASAPKKMASFPTNPAAIYLGNIDYEKGTDRLIEIAEALEEMNAEALRIEVYGMARSSSVFMKSLKKRILDNKLENRISFMGHVKNPEEVLAKSLALLRVSRWNDPWGRDVIEATRAGLPVLATGTMDGVVEHGKTGFLYEEFNAKDMALKLLELSQSKPYWESISEASILKGNEKFSGIYQVERATSVFKDIVLTGTS